MMFSKVILESKKEAFVIVQEVLVHDVLKDVTIEPSDDYLQDHFFMFD